MQTTSIAYTKLKRIQPVFYTLYHMDFLLTFFIFLTVVFLYIHIVHQYKRSEDLEVYEMDFSTNAHLQEVCDIRQPVTFHFYPVIGPNFFNKLTMEAIDTGHSSYDVRLKDTHDYEKATEGPVDYLVLPCGNVRSLMLTDPSAHFFTEQNGEFLEESGLARNLVHMNEYIKPSFTLNTHYDLTFGSKGATTPLRYHTHSRHYMCVTSGKIHVKMTPWKSTKYLHLYKDYDNYEFRSPVNPWKPQPEYQHDVDKAKFLEFDIYSGYVLYIPSYWWYSIRFETESTSAITVTYDTAMGLIANLHDIGMYFLQQQNTTKKISKPPAPLAAPVYTNPPAPAVDTNPVAEPHNSTCNDESSQEIILAQSQPLIDLMSS
jgi:hypothetical protein